MDHHKGFFAKLDAAVSRNSSLLCVGLDPQLANLPQTFRSIEDPLEALLAWNRSIVESTAPYAAAFKPNIAFYEALGKPGYDLLLKTLGLIPDTIPVILDAKRGDMGNTAVAYAEACFDRLGADAVTLSPYLGRDSIEPFSAYHDKGLFVLCHTSNPGAQDVQEHEVTDWRTLDRMPNQPLYVHVARLATSWGPNVGLVVGATYPAAIERVREVVPDAWILVPGIGAQGGDLEGALKAGLRADGSGLIISASRSIANADNPAAAARELRDAINAGRSVTASTTPTGGISPQIRSLIDGLIELEAIKFGEFTLASGQNSPIYIDLRLLVSAPDLLQSAARAYTAIVSGVGADRIAGVPYAALPIGTAVALQSRIPMIYPRKETKEYGLAKDIEGAWQPGERVVIVEDLITSGGSTIKTAERLRKAGLLVEDAVVLIDREQGGGANLAQAGIRAHAVMTMSQIVEDLVQRGRIAPDLAGRVRALLNGSTPA